MDIKLMPDKYDKKKKEASGFRLSSENVSQLSENLLSKGGFFFGLSIAFLILTILASLGLWGYKRTLVEEGESVVAQIKELRERRDIEFENKLMDLRNKIEGIKGILGNRIYSTSVFKMLEESVLPGVQFTEFSADLAKAGIQVTAMASTFESLTKQLIVFENDERIKKVSVSSVGLDESGKVSSDLSIELKSSAIYEQ